MVSNQSFFFIKYASLSILIISIFLEIEICQGYKSLNGPCPAMCVCKEVSINCKYKQLTSVPKNLPTNVEKLILGGNQIVQINSDDFRGLTRLKLLYLHKNEISVIRTGAFDDLISLRRLRLSHNRIRDLPDRIFQRNRHLTRLDLNDNQLRCIGGEALRGTSNLKYLQLAKNRISWIAAEPFYRMTNLKSLYLSDNPLNCNCHLKWLNEFMARRPKLFSQHRRYSRRGESRDSLLCDSPLRLKHKSLMALETYHFTCTEEERTRFASPCSQNRCSSFCKCTPDRIAICNKMELSEIPADLPSDIEEIQLNHNSISTIPSRAFEKYSNLKKLHLTGNKIKRLTKNAFSGLYQLEKLHLNYNEIKELHKDVFRDLKSLAILILNQNNISCIPKETFRNLGKLSILHLSQNNIQSIEHGTFDGLNNLRVLYLANNPLICDCHLSWLTGYSSENGRTLFASCVRPTNLAGKQLRQLKPMDFSCSGRESDITKRAGRCTSEEDCPSKCRCKNTKIDCSKAGLTDIPKNIPPKTTSLNLQWNHITHIPSNSSLMKLENLRILDLSSNEISQIELGAFSGLARLNKLDLSNNQLSSIDDAKFKGMKQLDTLILRNNNITCLNNDAFNAISQIKSLYLNDNKIRCIMSGVFNGLRKLQTLSLANNALNCNCRLSWLSDWLRQNNAIIGQSQVVTCSSPDLLKNTPLTALKAQYFLCRENSSQPGCENGVEPCCSKDVLNCDSRAHCPENCNCEGTIIRCNQKNLTEVPSDIPADTTELYLERNSIKQLNSSSFKQLNKLQTLALSYNVISELRENTFKDLPELQTLIISFNELQCIHPQAFAGLHKLKALILQGNDLSTIPYGSFDDLTNLNNIALSQNPFYCDCNLKWLKDFFRKNFLDNGMALCSGPADMSLKSIYHAKATHFQCTSSTPTSIGNKCNVCLAKQPCLHDGICHLIGYHDYRCECRQPFHGKNCEQQINACFGKPCKNGGVCHNTDNYGNYKCVCQEGFSGPRCTINYDDCVGHRCQNGGVCVDKINNYTCSCPEGFRGQFCEEAFKYCVDENPCKNEAKCVPKGLSYECSCKTGWRGRKCEENIDDCLHHACQNGAECVDDLNEYRCKCRPGYEGKYCENLSWTPPMSRSLSCSLNRCQNGAICQDIAQRPGYLCKCQPGYVGDLCEQLHSVTFNRNSFAAYHSPRPTLLVPSGNITIHISTHSRSGIILYAEDGDKYLTVDLYNGHVRIIFNLGLTESTGFSTNTINDRLLHKLVIIINGENVTMDLDNTRHIYLRTEYRHTRHISLSQPIYIGMVPEYVMTSAKKIWRLSSQNSFVGCLRSIFINGEPIDFLRLRNQSNNLRPGCVTAPVLPGQQSDSRIPSLMGLSSEPVNSVCTERMNLCLNSGVCVPNAKQKDGYTCKCGPDYTGSRCEIRRNSYQKVNRQQNPYQNSYGRVNSRGAGRYRQYSSRAQYACRRVHDRTFMKDPETMCVSKRKVKIRICAGQCHSSYSGAATSCCRPVRFKKKRIGFVCLNGHSYNKWVTLIRKCACSNCHG